MMRDIDQQVRLLERLHPFILEADGRFERRGGHGALGDEDAGGELVLVDVLAEFLHLFNADGALGGELDPNGADLGRCGGLGVGG